MKRPVIVLVAGVLFGAGLAVSGMTDPARVIGFLDVTGAWDPSLAFVMGGAVGALGIGLLLWRAVVGPTGWFGAALPKRDTDPVDRRLVAGAILFGVGWGIGGYCPGPALAGLAGWRMESLVFVPAMALGMWLARKIGGVDAD